MIQVDWVHRQIQGILLNYYHRKRMIYHAGIENDAANKKDIETRTLLSDQDWVLLVQAQVLPSPVPTRCA